MKTFEEFLDESISATWLNPEWRQARKIYNRKNIRKVNDHETGFTTDAPGWKGKVSRIAVTATAPIGQHLQKKEVGIERKNRNEKPWTKKDRFYDDLITTHAPIFNLKWHHDNIREIQQKLRQQKRTKPQ